MRTKDNEVLGAAVSAAIREAQHTINVCPDLNTQGGQEALAWLRGVQGRLEPRATPTTRQWMAYWALGRPGYDHFIEAFASLTPVTRAVCKFRRRPTTKRFQKVRRAVDEVLRTGQDKIAATGRSPTNRESKYMQWLAALDQPFSVPAREYGWYDTEFGCWPPCRDDY